MNSADRIFEVFAASGQALYFGEAVTETEHALQTAHQAEQAGAANALVVAALLHDFGHLIHGLPESIANEGIDGRHEEAGAAWLARFFGEEITAPVRLHVAAKRYLAAAEPAYFESLSPASMQSLRLQGGPFDAAGAEAFEREPCFAAAVALRRWDDAAKVPGLAVPGLEHYRVRLEAALARAGEARHRHPAEERA
jgi:phosphonate degradation associated HDIG domain protein